MAQAAGRTNHNSHNDSTMQAFTDANNAAVQAAKDIRDLVDARDENDLWDESEEGTLDDLMVTLTRKKRLRDEAWGTLIMTNLDRDDDEFLLAIDDLQIHKGYADIMMNRASHVAKRSIVIIRLQSAKQRRRPAAERSHEAEEVCRLPRGATTSTNERDEMIAEASTKRKSEGQREGISPAERNDLSPAEGTQEENKARNAEGVASHRPSEKSGGGPKWRKTNHSRESD